MKGARSRVAVALIVVAIIVVTLAGREAAAYLPRFARWVESFGAWGPVVFVSGYALAVVGFVPGSILTLAAGAIFGLRRGIVYAFVAATLGASLAFLIARYLARDAIERRLAGNRRFDAIDRAIGAEGRRIVLLLRLSPAFPFNLLNYALGLTTVRFIDYLAASIGMLPGTMLYVYYGKVAGDVAILAGNPRIEKDAAYYMFLVTGLAATAIAATIVARIARRALNDVEA